MFRARQISRGAGGFRGAGLCAGGFRRMMAGRDAGPTADRSHPLFIAFAIFFHASRRVVVRLNTRWSAVESLSTQKYP